MRALDGVDLEVGPPEVVILLGRNGAGKSTLMRILASSVLPDTGRVWMNGRELVGGRGRATSGVGLVLGEDRSFFWRLSGLQNLEFFAAMHGMRRARARQAAREALEAVGLAEVGTRRVDRYSTGMRSRLGIARALLGAPRLLLLDEPTRSLDPEAAAAVRALVAAYAVSAPCAVLLATHDLHEAASLASRVVVLDAGRVRTTFTAGVTPAELERALTGAAT